jgi:hypothetical protein
VKRLWAAVVALVLYREINDDADRVSGEYAALEREILDDDGPFDWPERDVLEPEYCGCRLCHDHGIGEFTDDAVEQAFQGMLDVPDTRQFAERFKRTRGRKWTP